MGQEEKSVAIKRHALPRPGTLARAHTPYEKPTPYRAYIHPPVEQNNLSLLYLFFHFEVRTLYRKNSLQYYQLADFLSPTYEILLKIYFSVLQSCLQLPTDSFHISQLIQAVSVYASARE